MMGERTVAQEALFYSSTWSGMYQLTTCCVQSTGSWTCRAFVSI